MLQFKCDNMKLKKEYWTNQDYIEFTDYLKHIANIKYKQFSEKIIFDNTILGINIPTLIKIANEIYKGNYIEFLEISKNDTYEEKLIYALVISNIKDYNVVICYINKYKYKINNWALCDILCSHLKIVKKYQKEFLMYIKRNIKNQNLWIKRMCFVLLLNYYIEEEYINDIFDMINKYNSNDYYVQMSVAWLISICYVKYKEKTLKYLENKELDNFTYNKALQKIIESKRVTKEEKNIIRNMKRG